MGSRFNYFMVKIISWTKKISIRIKHEQIWKIKIPKSLILKKEIYFGKTKKKKKKKVQSTLIFKLQLFVEKQPLVEIYIGKTNFNLTFFVVA